MEGLQKFLSRYTHLIPPEGSKRKKILEVIQNECGIRLEEKEIKLQGSGVYLQCHPTIRGEIRLCAPRVLSVLHQEHNIHIAFIR